MRFTCLLLIFVFIGCAGVNRTRKNLVRSKVNIKGGVFRDIEWKEKLTFERYSWSEELVMNYDVLLAKLSPNSPFIHWMENDKEKMNGCDDFYIGLFYAKFRSEGVSYLTSQFEKSGLKVNIIPSFRANLRAHYNMTDLKLLQHKMFGVCRPSGSTKTVLMYIPGYKTYKLK